MAFGARNGWATARPGGGSRTLCGGMNAVMLAASATTLGSAIVSTQHQGVFTGAVNPISNKQFLTNQFFMDTLAVL